MHIAAELDAMAAKATHDVKHALEGLASGFRVFAAARATRPVADFTFERKPLAENTVEGLLQIAAELDAMAAKATPDVKHALEGLASGFRVFAAARATKRP